MSHQTLYQQFSVSRPAGDSIAFSLATSKFAVIFLLIFMSVFSAGALAALSSIETYSLPLIVQLLYDCWLVGIFSFLVIGWLFGIALLLGKEQLIFTSGYLIVRKEIFGIGISSYFIADAITDFLWLADPPPSSPQAGKGPHISFRYQQEKITCATNVTEAEAEKTHHNIEQQALNQTPGTDLHVKIQAYEQTAKEKVTAQRQRHQTLSPSKTSPSVIALLLVNVLPIIGVLFLDWTVTEVLVLYWSESAVIGIYSIFKMWLIDPWGSAIAAPFFTIHYGGFMAAHWLLLYNFVLPDEDLTTGFGANGIIASSLTLPFLALFVSHGVSFFQNFVGRAEYVDRDVRAQMGEPYGRILMMQFTLLIGGILASAFDSALPILLLLILCKTATDLRAHLLEHRPGLKTE